MTPHCSLTKRRRRREPEGLLFLGAPAAATKGGASARRSSPFSLPPPRLDGDVARQGPPPAPTAPTQHRCQPSPPCRKDKGREGKGRKDGSGGGGGEGCWGAWGGVGGGRTWWSERGGSPPDTETAAKGHEGPRPALSVARQKTHTQKDPTVHKPETC